MNIESLLPEGCTLLPRDKIPQVVRALFGENVFANPAGTIFGFTLSRAGEEGKKPIYYALH